jgi:DNA-binding NarL/FixJ family response regulator
MYPAICEGRRTGGCRTGLPAHGRFLTQSRRGSQPGPQGRRLGRILAQSAWLPFPMPSPEISVAIFDDNAGFRESLATLISASPGFRLAGAYSDVPSGLEELDRGIAQVVLLDVQMPGMSGIEGARQIRALKPGLPVVMLTAFDDSERVFESLRAGAVGYLLKRSTTAEILGAIQEAVAGGSPMSGRIARMVVHSFHSRTADLPENHNLSARERELLEFLAEGLRYKEVAARMSISLNTVRCYIRRVYEKLHAQSRTEALRRYQRR